MKAVLRNTVLCALSLAGIVLAAPHQSVTASPCLPTASCRLVQCSKPPVAAASPGSAFMHETATTLSW